MTGERDQASVAAQQNYRACQELQTELSTSRESENKLQREVSVCVCVVFCSVNPLSGAYKNDELYAKIMFN